LKRLPYVAEVSTKSSEVQIYFLERSSEAASNRYSSGQFDPGDLTSPPLSSPLKLEDNKPSKGVDALSRASQASISSRLILTGAFVFAVLTACESSEITERSAPSPDAPATAETPTLPASPPPASSASTQDNASPPLVGPTEPAPWTAPTAQPPTPEPRVPPNEPPVVVTADASPEATSAKAPDTTRPTVTIKSPAYGTLFNRNPVTVSGTVDDPTAAVTVNGVHATVKDGTFTTHVVLAEQGSNPLVGGTARGQA